MGFVLTYLFILKIKKIKKIKKEGAEFKEEILFHEPER